MLADIFTALNNTPQISCCLSNLNQALSVYVCVCLRVRVCVPACVFIPTHLLTGSLGLEPQWINHGVFTVYLLQNTMQTWQEPQWSWMCLEPTTNIKRPQHIRANFYIHTEFLKLFKLELKHFQGTQTRQILSTHFIDNHCIVFICLFGWLFKITWTVCLAYYYRMLSNLGAKRSQI